MPSKLPGVTLALSVAALAVAGYAVTMTRPGDADLAGRLDTMGERLARVERDVAAWERRHEEGPSLIGRVAEPDAAGPESAPAPREAGVVQRAPGEHVPGEGPAPEEPDPAEVAEEIRTLVDEAVEKKAAQFRRMENKKPSIEEFAKVLELTDDQRQAVAEEVVRGQHEIQAILQTPAADGTVFLDELVEVLADGIAHPGQNPGRSMRFFGRLLSEVVPGTTETYAAHVEAAKQSVRESLRREMTAEQYALFEAWRMDPTEIRDIEYSPWKDLEARILARARDLGAQIPSER